MRHPFAVPITTAVVISSLLASCGDDDSSNDGTTTATTTGTAAASAVCADISTMQSAASDFKQLNPDNASATEAKQALFALGTSIKALSSSASDATGQAQGESRICGEQLPV